MKQNITTSEISQNSLYMPNNNIAEQAGQYITSLMKETNSCGGVIECIADGLPVGLGEPVFDKLDALSHKLSCRSALLKA